MLFRSDGKSAAGALGACEFGFHDFEQAAIVRETGEWIADGEAADLIEQFGVVEKRAGQHDGVTRGFKELSGP